MGDANEKDGKGRRQSGRDAVFWSVHGGINDPCDWNLAIEECWVAVSAHLFCLCRRLLLFGGPAYTL